MGATSVLPKQNRVEKRGVALAMAQAVGTSMAALCGASNAILDGRRSGILGTSLPQKSAPSSRRIPAIIRASASNGDEAFQGRRSMLGLLAAAVAVGSSVQSSSANTDIVIKGPPPPSGGLPGTENSDQARDFDLPLKDRFFLQSLPPAEAAERAKDSAKDIVAVKSLIDKKAWPYVRNDLRSKAGYLRYDLNAIIASKPKELKKPLKDLTAKLFETIDKLDYAAREKSSEKANKYYVETVAALNDVLAKIA